MDSGYVYLFSLKKPRYLIDNQNLRFHTYIVTTSSSDSAVLALRDPGPEHYFQEETPFW